MFSLFCSVLFAHALVEISSSEWPYLQIYPPVNETDDRTPLYFALVLSTGGRFASIGALPGVQVALDYINNDSSLLPGYSLHYTLGDSECARFRTIRSFIQQVLTQPNKVGFVGSGCSRATEFTAELTPFYNLTQISCTTSISENDDQRLLKYYFQTLPSTDIMGYGFLNFVLHFKWKKVSIITFNEGVFNQMMDVLKEGLEFHGVEYTETLFLDVTDLGDEPYKTGARIFIWAMYPTQATHLTCEAHKRGIRYPKHQILMFGWYQEGWYLDSPFTDTELECSEEERARTIYTSLTVEMLDFDTGINNRSIWGLDIKKFIQETDLKYDSPLNSHLNLRHQRFSSSPDICFEATLSLALALHETLEDLRKNRALNEEAAREAGLDDGEMFTLANFSYSNFAIVQQMYHHLRSTDYLGINGRRVNFNDRGHRAFQTLQLGQYISNGSLLNHVTVGFVKNATINDSKLQLIPDTIQFPDGIPTDGIPIIKIASVSSLNIVIFSLLGKLGIAYTLVCVIFNLFHRKKKLIRLSSPNLNNLIAFGALVLYFDIFLLIIRPDNELVVLPIFYLDKLLLFTGYTLCFGTISSKMIRVWYIFNNPGQKKPFTIKDYHLLLIVMIFLVCDLLMFGLYALIEGLRGNLKLFLHRSTEQPDELVGPTAKVHQYYFYASFSRHLFILYILMTVGKVLLNLMALILAFCTRKVQMKGLDDSKFVILATYATNIFFFMGLAAIVSAYTGLFNVSIAFLGGNLFISTTTVLSLVFIPKMLALYKDPSGENVGLCSVIPRTVVTVLDCNGDRLTEKEKLVKKIQRLQFLLEQHNAMQAS